MDILARLQAIDQATLTPLVRDALGSDAVTLLDWQVAPLGGGVGRCVYRFAGHAQDQGQPMPWSLILKVVHAQEGAVDPSAPRYWKREMLAYQSGLLAGLPAGLQAPRCFAVVEQPGGGGWLWLEEIAHAATGRWPRERFIRVARHLGNFNGSYLAERSLPNHPWLSRGWLGSSAADVAPAIASLRAHLDHPLLRPAFPGTTADRVLHVWDEREVFLAALDSLPQTFCHLDAFPRNLFIQRETSEAAQLVAIDWEYAGVSALGTELASLVGASLIFEETALDTADDLEAAVFASYLQGLRDMGWRGDQKRVQLGYTVALVLHYMMVGLVVLEAGTEDEDLRQHMAQLWGHPYRELLDRQAALFAFQLARADEARHLLQAC